MMMKKVLFIVLLFAMNVYADEQMMLPPSVTIKTLNGNDLNGQYNLQYPEVLDTLAPKLKRKINTLFKQLFIKDRMCGADKNKANQMKVDTTIKISYLTNALLSLKLNYDSYCGGPYPDSGTQFYIFNLKKAEQLKLSNEMKDKKAFESLVIKAFLAKRNNNQVKDCEHLYTVNELSQYMPPQFLLNDGFITARLDFPHVARACEYDVRLNCRELVGFLKKRSLMNVYCAMKLLQ